MNWLTRIFTTATDGAYKLPLNGETHAAHTGYEHPFGRSILHLKRWAAVATSANQHTSPRYYIAIAIVLGTITAIEIMALSWRLEFVILTAIMLIFSAFKFVLVAAFYMHLRFDRRTYTLVFAGCMGLGLLIFNAVLLLTIFYGR